MKQRKYTVASKTGVSDDNGNMMYWYPMIDENGNLFDWSVGLHPTTPTFFSKNFAQDFLTKIQKERRDVPMQLVKV